MTSAVEELTNTGVWHTRKAQKDRRKVSSKTTSMVSLLHGVSFRDMLLPIPNWQKLTESFDIVLDDHGSQSEAVRLLPLVLT